MHVVFLCSDKPRERLLAEAFSEGVKAHGDSVEVQRLKPEVVVYPQADVACMVGVKSRELFAAHYRLGVHTVMIDKGYTRHAVSGGVRAWQYWRFAVDAHHPTHYLSRIARPADRLERLELKLGKWRREGAQIVFAGSSQKYHDFYSLPGPTEYASKQLKRLSRLSSRTLVYRPKPSWKDAVAIEGAGYSTEGSIAEALVGAHALVTHGSNACFEAVLLGIPCLILGDAVAKAISSTQLEEIEHLRLASQDERLQWLANLAYCQWTLAEMSSGEAWRTLRPVIYGA